MSLALSLSVQTLKDSSARHLLLCLANYAGSNGAGAFPSATTLAQDTGLSERTVRYKLDVLEESGLIKKGNQAIAAVHIDRHDRRPMVYDLQHIRGANPAPNTSINHQVTEQQLQREISDVVAEQDGRALRSTDSRQRFSMFAEWAYAPKQLESQLHLMGLKFDAVTDEVVGSFKGFFHR